MKLSFGVVLGVLATFLLFGSVSAAQISAKQSTLDEQQDACGAGEQLTSWHFIINQIDSEANAPDTIQVTWSNGDVEDVPIAKFTGKVAHYNVTGTATHTLIDSATADIYDGWPGNFNLSSFECGPATPPPLDACASFADRIVIEFGARLGNPAVGGLAAQSLPETVLIPAGTYMVTLQSSDFHSTQIPSLNQLQEQWFARFSNGGTFDSGTISDLPEDQDVLNEQVGTIIFTSDITEVVAVHALAGGPWPTPESIMAVCVALDPVQ